MTRKLLIVPRDSVEQWVIRLFDAFHQDSLANFGSQKHKRTHCKRVNENDREFQQFVFGYFLFIFGANTFAKLCRTVCSPLLSALTSGGKRWKHWKANGYIGFSFGDQPIEWNT